jgi:uncharacterized protein (DUF934 family)
MEGQMTTIITTSGVSQADTQHFTPLVEATASTTAFEIGADVNATQIFAQIGNASHIRINIGAMGDGRAFSLARRLRTLGYTGLLRAQGPLIADQFAALARVGFDEVELPASHAARLPQNPVLRDRAVRYQDLVAQ